MTLRRASAETSNPYAVVVTTGRYGYHCGILFRLKPGQPRILHLAWHLKLKVEDVGDADWWMVQPTLNRAQKSAVIVRAGQVAERHRDGAIPYGLGLEGVSIDDAGNVDLDDGVGLTCASFVQVLHGSVGASLVAVPSWDDRDQARRNEDDAVQARIVQALEAEGHSRHARRVRSQVGATRIRSEEVAAASGMQHRPAEYRDVLPEAQRVVGQLEAHGVAPRR